MTNQKRAAEVIEEAMGEVAMGYPSMLPEIAQALADAGLLMIDLPEPQFDHIDRWESSGVSLFRGRRTLELYVAADYGDLPETLEPDEARDTALALLAAANYIERNQE